MTIKVLHRFRPEGLRRFRDLLDQLNVNGSVSVDLDWIFDPNHAEQVNGEIPLPSGLPKGKRESAQALSAVIKLVDESTKYFDQRLWAWLSACYFEAVCPLDKKGRRKPGMQYRHIPPADRSWRTVYRHLLAGPVRILDLHPDSAKVLLSGELRTLGDFMEQIASRQDLAGCRGVVEALDLLYWDSGVGRPKPGVRTTGHEAGSLRRFVDVIQQLQVTYDLFALPGEDIVELLPQAEFGRWAK